MKTAKLNSTIGSIQKIMFLISPIKMYAILHIGIFYEFFCRKKASYVIMQISNLHAI